MDQFHAGQVDQFQSGADTPIVRETFQSAGTVSPGATVQFKVIAEIPSGAGTLGFRWTSNADYFSSSAPTLRVADGAPNEVTWTAPEEEGLYSVRVKVKNSETEGEVERTFDIGVLAQGGAGPVRVAAGLSHSLLLKPDGTLWAAGSDAFGQFGNGNAQGGGAEWKQVLTEVISMAAGEKHTLALKRDGTLWATGWNLKGQIGNGTTTDSVTFVQVLTGVRSIAAGARSQRQASPSRRS